MLIRRAAAANGRTGLCGFVGVAGLIAAMCVGESVLAQSALPATSQRVADHGAEAEDDVKGTDGSDEGVARDAGASMRERAELLLRGFDEFSAVTVQQHDNVLVLNGKVSSTDEQAALVALIASVPEVTHVYDRTAIETAPSGASNDDASLQETLEGVFANVSGLKGVQVTVRSGVVTLSGQSASARLIDKAEQLASNTEGVVFVENKIDQTALLGEQVQLPMDRLKARAATWLRKSPILLFALGVVVASLLIARVLTSLDFAFRWINGALLRDIVKRIVSTVVVVAGLLVALELLELTSFVGAVFGAAGAAGIILGFAFREIIENYLASLLLSIRRPFLANDHVVIGTREGKIIRMTSRDTILMTLEGNHLRLPNSIVFKAEILNYTRNPLRRFDFAVGLGVDEDITAAIELGLQELRAVPGVCSDPACFARVEELGDSNVALRFFCWVDQAEADWFKVRSEAIRRTKVALDDAGVDMPVPIYQVNLRRPSSSSPGETPKRQLPTRRHEAAHEVIVDDVLERQMDADRQREDSDDLLSRQ